MNVNFNNLRKQAIYSYHRLCTTLNESIKDRSFDPTVIVDPDDIQRDMDDLRSYLWSICCVYRDGDEEFRDLTEEIEAKGEIASFNEQD